MLHHGHNEFNGPDDIFVGAYLFVEYFFMLTGYFTAKHFSPREGKIGCKEAVLYTLSKLSRCLPYACLGCVLEIIFSWEGLSLIEKILAAPFAMFPLQGTFIALYSFNFPLWYMTGILFYLPLLIMLMKNSEAVYRPYLCWVIPLMIYSYLMSTFGDVAAWDTRFTKFLCCNLRPIAGLCTGMCIFYLTEWIKLKKSSLTLVQCFGVLIWLCIAFVILIGRRIGYHHMYAASYIFYFFVAGICIFSSNYSNKMPDYFFRKLILHLGRLSLPIYCLHMWVLQMVQKYFTAMGFYRKCAVSILICILLFEISMYIVRLVRKKEDAI